MQFDDNRVDTSRVRDQRDGKSGGGGFSMGGGGGGGGMGVAAVGGVLAMLLRGKGGRGMLGLVLIGALVLGGMTMCSRVSQNASNNSFSTQSVEGAGTDLETRCNTDGALQQYPDCLLVKAFNETDEVWSQEFQRMGVDYRAPALTFFDGSVNTACGQATTAVGPFYCPGDESIYFDLGFADQLQQLGVKGDYANIYIMAHEFGHHLQNITGIEKQVRQAQQQNPRQTNQYGVKMELQADCMAGAWGRLANDRGNVAVTQDEVKQAMDAAAAVGDDRIQQSAGQRVNPETWTHGSAAQRVQWYMTGFNSGDINRCNTFA